MSTKQVSSERIRSSAKSFHQYWRFHRILQCIWYYIVICVRSALISTIIYGVIVALDRVFARKPLTHRVDRHFIWVSAVVWSIFFFAIFIFSSHRLALQEILKRIKRASIFLFNPSDLQDNDPLETGGKKQSHCADDTFTSNHADHLSTVCVQVNKNNANAADEAVIAYKSTESKNTAHVHLEQEEPASIIQSESHTQCTSLCAVHQSPCKQVSVMIHSHNGHQRGNDQSLLLRVNSSLAPVSVSPHHSPVAAYSTPVILGQAISCGHFFHPFSPVHHAHAADSSSHQMGGTSCQIDHSRLNAYSVPSTSGPSAPPYPW